MESSPQAEPGESVFPATDPPARAVHRVLHLPELLELILLNLSQRELLLSQRVSQGFHSTVNTSPVIQKALFLLPDTTPHPPPFSQASVTAAAATITNTSQSQTRPNIKPANNRLLLRAFPGGEYPTVHLHIEYKPTLSDLESGRRGEEFYAWTVNISFPALSEPGQLPAACSPAASYPEASWRRMFLCQPPCEDLRLVRRHMRSQEPAIVRKGGITMGDFVAEVTATGEEKGKDEVWKSGFVSSDGDWHFEGEVRCSLVEE